MPLLYSIVFGEGVINDATSIVVLSAVQVRARTACVIGAMGLGSCPRVCLRTACMRAVGWACATPIETLLKLLKSF